MQCIPVRHAGRADRAAHPRGADDVRAARPGELERTYLEAFDRFARMIAEGSFPFDVDEIEIESAPRVGDGVILLDAETRVKFASPNAVSSLHRLGIHAYTQRAAARRHRLRRRARPGTAMRRHLPVIEEIERDDVSMLLRVHPAARGRRADRRARPHARRHRPPPPRPDADVEGRDDPRDPPPGEEQPADDRVAAAAPGPPARVARGAGRRSPSRSGGSARSRSCTRRSRATRATSCASARSCARWRRLVEDTVVVARARDPLRVDGDAGELPGEVATPLAVVLNELMQNAVDHAFPDGDRRGRQVDGACSARDDETSRSRCVDDGVGLPDGFSLEASRASASRSCRRSSPASSAARSRCAATTGTSVRVRVPVAMPRVEL